MMATETKVREGVVQPDGTIKLSRRALERAGIKPGDKVFCYADGPGAIVLHLVSSRSPQELFERYGDPDITEIDWAKLRAEVEEDMARDAIAELGRNE